MKSCLKKKTFIENAYARPLKLQSRAQIQALKFITKDYFGPLNPKQREIIKEIMASNKYMQNMAEKCAYKL